jgi:hypothetical protein
MGMTLADFTENVIDEFGESATLCGEDWRQAVTVVFTPAWAAAAAGGIGIERSEPVAQLRTTDADTYGVDNGWALEIGADTYRITSRADDGLGLTLLTLAKQ